MSSRRARSGGRWISIVFSRNSRSWRKRVSSASRSAGRLVAATTRTSIGTGRLDPTGHHLPLLERGQQLGLEMERQIADFVEEQGAVVGRLEPPHAVAGGAGEGALDVAEQLGLEQAFGGRAKVDRRPSAGSLRRDWRWISRATISLPVPFSPRIRTLASVGAARSIRVAHAVHRLGIAKQRHLAVDVAKLGASGRARSAPRACSGAAPPRCGPWRRAARCSTAWRRNRWRRA